MANALPLLLCVHSPRRSTILAKGLDLLDLPILAGYLRTECRGGPRELKAKDRWIELWNKGENRGAFLLFLESPGEQRGRLELTLQDVRSFRWVCVCVALQLAYSRG